MKSYEEAVEKVMKLIKKQKMCLWSRNAHRTCYNELKDFLIDNRLKYTDENIQRWLEEIIRLDRNSQEYTARWRYMDQLSEFIATGTIINDHLLLTKSYYNKLPTTLKMEVDQYLEFCYKRYSERSFLLAKIYCSHFALYMHEKGIGTLNELSYNNICCFYEANHHCSSKSRFCLLSHARKLLKFYASRNICKIGFSILLKDDMYPYVVVYNQLRDENSKKIKLFSSKSAKYSAEDMYDAVDCFIEKYKENDYSYTIIKNARHTLNALYLFLDINDLNYRPEIADLWFDTIKPIIGSSYNSWHRVLKLFEYYMESKQFNYNSKCLPEQNRSDKYPLWCQEGIKSYLDWLKRSFHTENTIRSYKFSVYNFCDYLIAYGLTSFQGITPVIIHAYLAQDHHKTFKGRAGRIMIVKQFVHHLEDLETISDKKLHLCLSSGTAPIVTIVTVLTDEDIKSIYTYRDKCRKPIEIRHVTMVLVGLRLGLRASDVVNLKFTDIDWKQQSISIIQEKTRTAITLPLSNDVGNALFKYIRSARPESTSNYIFIRHHASYGKLTTKICSNALYAILPEKKTLSIGFHVLRRTFATKILNRNAGIESVIDSLGHQDNTTVMKYLSFNQERMKQCPLSLEECDIELKGVNL